MKNITALAFLVIINCVYIFINPVFSQETRNNRYTVSVSPQAGLIYGQVFEYVYPNPLQRETKAELYSELKWEIKPVYYVGLQLDFEPADIMRSLGFFSSLSFKAGLPNDSGVMEDRDWFFPENSELTRFSSHTNRTNSFFALDAALGISLPVKSIICFKPFLSGSWMRFSFTGRDGYYDYKDIKHPKGQLSGDVINYRQDWLLVATGFSVETNVLYPFAIDVSFQISPFTYCNALDEHIKREVFFRDYTSMGLFFEQKLNITLNMNRIALLLDVSYRRIGKTKGKSYKKGEEYTDFTIVQNEGGAGLSLLDTRFLVKIHLF